MRLSDDEVAFLLKMVDKDSDGRVEFSEFKSLVLADDNGKAIERRQRRESGRRMAPLDMGRPRSRKGSGKKKKGSPKASPKSRQRRSASRAYREDKIDRGDVRHDGDKALEIQSLAEEGDQGKWAGDLRTIVIPGTNSCNPWYQQL